MRDPLYRSSGQCQSYSRSGRRRKRAGCRCGGAWSGEQRQHSKDIVVEEQILDKAYGSMVIYVTKGSDEKRLLKGRYFDLAAESQRHDIVGMGGCIRDTRINPARKTLASYSVTLGLRDDQNPYTAELEDKAMALRCTCRISAEGDSCPDQQPVGSASSWPATSTIWPV
jgi:hypothetical protein